MQRSLTRRARAEALLDTAIEVIRREGPACSIDDVAAAVGVTRPVIYRYFGSRDGLATAVAARVAGQINAALAAAIAAGAEGRELLRDTIDAYLGFIEREPALYHYLVRGPTDAKRRARLAAFVDELGRQLAGVIAERLRAVGGDPAAAAPWAYALVGMVGFAGDWWLEQRTVPRRRLVEYLTQLAWDGMAHAPAAAGAAHRRRNQHAG